MTGENGDGTRPIVSLPLAFSGVLVSTVISKDQAKTHQKVLLWTGENKTKMLVWAKMFASFSSSLKGISVAGVSFVLLKKPRENEPSLTEELLKDKFNRKH